MWQLQTFQASRPRLCNGQTWRAGNHIQTKKYIVGDVFTLYWHMIFGGAVLCWLRYPVLGHCARMHAFSCSSEHQGQCHRDHILPRLSPTSLHCADGPEYHAKDECEVFTCPEKPSRADTHVTSLHKHH